MPEIIKDTEEYFDRGLGEKVKGRRHRRELMKRKGLDEIGTETDTIDALPTEIDASDDTPVELIERVMEDVARGVDPDVAAAEARDAMER